MRSDINDVPWLHLRHDKLPVFTMLTQRIEKKLVFILSPLALIMRIRHWLQNFSGMLLDFWNGTLGGLEIVHLACPPYFETLTTEKILAWNWKPISDFEETSLIPFQNL